MISSSRGGPDSSPSRWGKRVIQLSLSGWPRVCVWHTGDAQAPPGSGFRRGRGFSSPGSGFRSPDCKFQGASTPPQRLTSPRYEARGFLSPGGSGSPNALPTGSEDLPSRLPLEGRSGLWFIQRRLKGAARSNRGPSG